MTWFGEPPCALVSVTLFLIAFIYTPLGVFLVADVNSIFATIHYAPHHLVTLIQWIFATLFVLWLLFFLSRTAKVSGR